jgi:hypothetical protein
LLSGIVKDEQGSVIPFAKVTIKALETGLEKTVQADGDGSFAIPQLPPGQYAVRATAQGFGVEQRFVTLQPGQEGNVTVVLTGGPIPRVPPESPPAHRRPTAKPPIPKTIAVCPPVEASQLHPLRISTITEQRFAEKEELEKWLNEQSELGRALLSVIPLKSKRSMLFLGDVGKANSAVYRVLAVDKPLRAAALQQEIGDPPGSTFIGVHRLGNTSYLVVFRNDSE